MSAQRKPACDSLVFGWERLADLLVDDAKGLADLFFEHWAEVGVHKYEVPLDPDWSRLLHLNESGIFHIWTARDDLDLTLVGYLTAYVQPHIEHRTTLTAEFGPYFLLADYRRGANGLKLFMTALERFKAMGVKRVIGHSRIGKLDVIYKRLGFEPLDQTWDRLL